MWNPFKKSKILDLTEKRTITPSDNVQAVSAVSSDSSVSSNSGNVLGFLGNLASSSTSTSSTPATSSTISTDSPQHLKVKIEDVEYKIDNLMKKYASLIDRVDLAEKRLDRVDRR